MRPPGKLYNLRDRDKLLLPLPQRLRHPRAGALVRTAACTQKVIEETAELRTFSPFCSRTVTLFSFCSCSNTK